MIHAKLHFFGGKCKKNFYGSPRVVILYKEFHQLIYIFMKKFATLAFCFAVATGMFFGCDSKGKLAEDITGTWSAAPVKLTNSEQGYSSITETYMFDRDSTAPSGTVMITSMISLQKAAPANAAPTAPFMMTAAARATISGSWVAIDDDDLAVQLNPETLNVLVDPSMVEVAMNPISGQTETTADSISPSMLSYVKATITQELNVHYAGFTKIDDIKFKQKGAVMEFEVGKTDYSLMRQGPTGK